MMNITIEDSISYYDDFFLFLCHVPKAPHSLSEPIDCLTMAFPQALTFFFMFLFITKAQARIYLTYYLKEERRNNQKKVFI
jgi:hypothetical protein